MSQSVKDHMGRPIIVVTGIGVVTSLGEGTVLRPGPFAYTGQKIRHRGDCTIKYRFERFFSRPIVRCGFSRGDQLGPADGNL